MTEGVEVHKDDGKEWKAKDDRRRIGRRK